MKKPLLSYLFLIFIFESVISFAQTENNFKCGTTTVERELLKSLEYKKQKEDYEKAYRETMNNEALQKSEALLYTIPVVIHIVHDNQPIGTTFNPSDEYVITELNEGTEKFRHVSGATFANPYSGRDTEIEFCLATTDPNGNFTTGIVRHSLPDLPVYTDSRSSPLLIPLVYELKWDTENYLNIFLIKNTGVAGVYLGTTSSDVVVFETDRYSAALFTHEVGHYFSLKHTFNNGCDNNDCLSDGDFVCDTPPDGVSGCNKGGNSCTTDEDDSSLNNPFRTVALGGLGEQPDSYENYMDYSGSVGCWSAFTQGQKDRMRFNIENNRLDLIENSIECSFQSNPVVDAGIIYINTNYLKCNNTFKPVVDIENFGLSNILSLEIKIIINEILIETFVWNGTILINEIGNINLNTINLIAGVNTIEIELTKVNGINDGNTHNNASNTTIIHNQTLFFPYSFDFEPIGDYSRLPEGSSITNVVNNDKNSTFWRLKALDDPDNYPHYCSQGALILYNYKSIGTLNTSTFALPLLDLSYVDNPTLSFDLAYIPRDITEIDNLKINIIENCNTVTTIFDKSGLQLATNTPPAYDNSASYNFPECEENFITFSLDLSPYNNVETCFEFIATGKFYKTLLTLDNINLNGDCLPTLEITADTHFKNLYYSCGGIATIDVLTVQQNQQVQYCANRVRLNEGFKVEAGADFKVRINECD